MKNIYKNILITGASSGIGKGLAVFYAKNGAENLFISGRNAKRLNEVEKECKKHCKNVFAVKLDVTDRDAMRNWINESNSKAALDLVYANAGVGTTDDGIEAAYDTFNININGVLNTVLPVIEIYKKSERKSINDIKSIAVLSSIAGYHGLATCPDYSATKACVKAWGEALRIKLKPEGINVSVICPGFVKSNITDQNTCSMPGIKEIDEAAEIIADGLNKHKAVISFPWYLRLATWFLSILPNFISDYIYSILPQKA
ncbi:MAG: SDR family NAD(P)-dependent oxidoreductase [Lactobacillaceae bacterium]|jgi:short-subunit dehydrogenase|nr:SDR family NAD(P)-dependent oxidoreductase [Lactobacillaceae bacterium]